MIVTRTPLRLSLFSGGSDMQSFYKHKWGAALSATIDVYVYVMVHHRDGWRRGFQTMFPQGAENVDNLEVMRNAITRECLRFGGAHEGAIVSSMSDAPSNGTGLGSSSAFTVGLLHCLLRKPLPDSILHPYWRQSLAEDACTVEIDKCGYPLGKQDAYAAAMGGFNLFKFEYQTGYVDIEKLYLRPEVLSELQNNLLLVYSGRGRSANGILWQQIDAAKDPRKMSLIQDNRDRAVLARNILTKKGACVDDIGSMLHEAWQAKKQLVDGISDDYLDGVYQTALQSGAIGGKVLGAGGGGFLLFYVKPDRRSDVIVNLASEWPDCQVYPFKFVFNGVETVTR